MIMKRIILCAAALVILCLNTAPVYALGVGAFGHFDGGKMVWNNFGANFMNYGGGLVIDTNLAGNQLFNYRMEFGVTNLSTPFRSKEYDIVKSAVPMMVYPHIPSLDYTPVTCDSNSIVLTTVHYFGFGVVRSKHLRIWLGPQVTFGAMVTQLTGVYAGLGLAAGMNINMGEDFTLSLVGAGRFLGGGRFYRHNAIFFRTGGYGGGGMITAAIIFRVPGDTY